MEQEFSKFMESDKSPMNWSQFKDSDSHMRLAGAVVASWSLTLGVAGSNPFTVMINIFVTEFAECSGNI